MFRWKLRKLTNSLGAFYRQFDEMEKVDKINKEIKRLKGKDIYWLITKCDKNHLLEVTRNLMIRGYLQLDNAYVINKSDQSRISFFAVIASRLKFYDKPEFVRLVKNSGLDQNVLDSIMSDGGSVKLAEALLDVVDLSAESKWVHIIKKWDPRGIPPLMDRIREKSDLRNSEEVAVALIRSSSEAPIHFAALFRDNMELEHSKVLACLLKECDSDEIPYLVKNLEGNPCLRNEGFVRRLIEECDSERQVFLFDALAGNEMLENPKIIQDFVENIQPSDLVRLVERLQGNPVLESKEIVQKLFAYCEEGNDKGVLHNLLKSEFFRTVHIKDQDIFTTVESTFELTNELITVEDKSYDKLSNLNKIYFQSVFHEVVEQYGEVGEKEIQAAFFLKTQRAIISSVFPKREEREDYRAFEITVLPGGGFTVIEGEKETIFDVLFNCSVKPVQAPLFEEGEKAKPPIPGEKDTDLDLQAE